MSIFSEETLSAMERVEGHDQERKSYLREKYAFSLNNPSPTVRVNAAAAADKEVTDPEEREWLAREVADVSNWKGKLRQQKRSEAGILGRVGGIAAEAGAAAGESFLATARTVQDLTKGALGASPSAETVRFTRLLESAKQTGNPDVAAGAGLPEEMAIKGAGISSDILLAGKIAKLGSLGAASVWGATQYPESQKDYLEAGLQPTTSALAAAPTAAITGAIETLLPDPLRSKGVGGRLVKKVAEKVVKPVSKKIAKPLTRRLLRGGAEATGRLAWETLEESAQAMAQEAGLFAAGELSEGVEPREPTEIVKAGVSAAKEAGPALVPWMGGGGIKKGVVDVQRFRKFAAGSKRAKNEAAMMQHAQDGTTPSRREWKELNLPNDEEGRVPSGVNRKAAVAELAEEYVEADQIQTAHKGMAPTKEQWDLWGELAHEGETAEQRQRFLMDKFSRAAQVEEEATAPQAEVEQGPIEQPVAPLGVLEGLEPPIGPPVAGSEAAVEPGVSEVALGPEGVTEAPVAPDVLQPGMAPVAPIEAPAELDRVVALNKATNIKIRETVNLPELSNEAVQSMDSVMDEVAIQKLDEKALDVADEILDAPHRKRRQITTYEHVAMVLKAGKLLDDLDAERAIQGEAAQSGNRAAHEQSTGRERVIVKQLDRLTQAARYSRREIARALSIGRLRLSRDNYDVVHVLGLAQASKGRRLTQKERNEITRLSKENASLVEEIARLEEDAKTKEYLEEKVLAQKVLNAKKRKGAIGEGIRRRAKAKQKVLKDRIRAMGEVGRVNDITGVTVEGSYLIGRLGIAYIEEGAGTLVEVIEKLRTTFPDLDLTEQDVYQTLIMRSPKEVTRARSEASKNVAKLTSIARRLLTLDNLAQDLPGKVTPKRVEYQEVTRLNKMQSALRRRLKAEEKLEEAKRGELPISKEAPADTPVIAAIKAETREVQKLLRAAKKVKSAKKGKFPEPRKRVPTSKELRELQKEFARLSGEFYKSDMDASKIEAAIEKINRLQDDLANGVKSIKKDPKEIPPELANLKEEIRGLVRAIRVNTELDKAKEQLRTGEIPVPVKREKKPLSRDLQRKEIQLMQKRREVRQMVADLAPWDKWKVGKEIAYSAKAIAATADISFTMRQNLWQVFSHPAQAAKAFIPAMEAFLDQNKADEINNALLQSKNAPLYELAGIAIQDSSSPDAQNMSEVFRGKVIENWKVPKGVPILGGKQNPFGQLMSMSSRHAVTIGNLMRTSAFDQFMADTPNATMREMTAMADYINASTGLGELGKFGAIGDALQVVFFSPRFAISRVQTPWKLAKYWSMPRVRKQIAIDMVRVASTGGMVLALASLLGGGVNWDDPDDPDWGKIRIGNMRIDIWGGFQQPMRLIARIPIIPFKEKVNFSPLELLMRFTAFKVSPAISIPSEILTGKTAVGEDTDLWGVPRLGTVTQSLIPLVFRDVGEAWSEHGAGGAALAGVLAATGVGVSTYEDSQTATRKKIKKLKQAGNKSEAEVLRKEWNKRNPKQRILVVR